MQMMEGVKRWWGVNRRLLREAWSLLPWHWWGAAVPIPWGVGARWWGPDETLLSVGPVFGYFPVCCSGGKRRSGKAIPFPLSSYREKFAVIHHRGSLKQLRHVPWPLWRIPCCCLYSSVRSFSVSRGSGEESNACAKMKDSWWKCCSKINVYWLDSLILLLFYFFLRSFVVLLRKFKLPEPDLAQVFAVAVCLSPLLCLSYFSTALGTELCSSNQQRFEIQGENTASPVIWSNCVI